MTAIKAVHNQKACVFKVPLDAHVSTASAALRQLLGKFRDVKEKPASIRARAAQGSMHPRECTNFVASPIIIVYKFGFVRDAPSIA